MIGQENKSWGL